MSDCNLFYIWADDPADIALIHCPGCGGFLPSDFPTYRQFKCRKCGRTLECLPTDDEDQDMEFGGKLCLVPEYAVKEAS